MAIQKPFGISLQNQVFDANLPYTVKWRVSGDTSTSFSIEIYYNDSGLLRWSIPRTYSLALSYTLPDHILTNGLDYKLRITVWDSQNNTAISDYILFSTLSTPVVTVNNIGTIGNQSYAFSAIYDQTEGDYLSTYTVNLYDDSKKLIQTSNKLTDGALTYTFDLLQNNTSYFVEFIVVCQKGLSNASGLIPFTVVYEDFVPPLNITIEDLPDVASTKLTWKLDQVIGKADFQPEYINGEEVDARSGKVYFDQDFEVDSDFTLKIWFRELMQNVDLIYLSSATGNIQVLYGYDNKFYVYKYINNILVSTTVSPVVTGIQFYFYLQQQNGDITINVIPEVQASDVITTINNMTFADLSNVTIDKLKYAKFH